MSLYRCPHCHDIINDEDLLLSYICEICGVEFNQIESVNPNDPIEISMNKYKDPVCLYTVVCGTCRGAVDSGVVNLLQDLKEGKLVKEAEAVEAENRNNLIREVQQNENERNKPKDPKKPPVDPIEIDPIEINPIEIDPPNKVKP